MLNGKFKNKKIGLQYPIKNTVLQFDQTTDLFEEKRVSLHHMINTYLGEIPFQPNFGCRFKEIVFSDKSIEEIKSFIFEDVKSQLAIWHSDTSIFEKDIIIESFPDKYLLVIELKLNVNILPEFFEVSFILNFKI